MNRNQLIEFMTRHKMTQKQFADLLGVTPMAVDHWLRGRRTVNLTTVRICNMFDRHPQLMKEF